MFNRRIGMKNENMTKIRNYEIENDYISPSSPSVSA
jgi:hypothetical protein